MSELWDVYDKDRIRTGKTVESSSELSAGEYRSVIHAAIIDSEGKMLIQQRQPSKKTFGGLWDLSVGGHIISGETSSEGASRELCEELGLDVPAAELRPSLTVNFDTGFDDIYIIRRDIDPSSLSLQAEEVVAVRLADMEEILSMIDTGEFIPYHKSLVELIFAMKDVMGVHSTRESRCSHDNS